MRRKDLIFEDEGLLGSFSIQLFLGDPFHRIVLQLIIAVSIEGTNLSQEYFSLTSFP